MILDWFPFYWQKFLLGTADLSAQEVGAYVRLLFFQWDKGFVPTDPTELRKITKVSFRNLQKVLRKFQKFDNFLLNIRLEEIRTEQEEKRGIRSESGIKAARIRHNKPGVAFENSCDRMPIDETRVDERRTDKTREGELIFPWVSEDFVKKWDLWKKFKKEQFKFTYRGIISEQASLKKLSEISGGSSETAIEIIQQSIDNGWRGLFILKNDEKSNSKAPKQFIRSNVEESVLRNFAPEQPRNVPN